jgi:Icc-related predicted phosphoesterase
MKIAALGDIHIGLTDKELYKPLFEQVSKEADVVCICGDLTQTGIVEEIEILKENLLSLSIPSVLVLGNHDYEKDLYEDIMKTLTTDRTTVLQGTHVVIEGIGFAGVKGFIGGFGDHLLPFWGERLLKDVVQHGIDEALALEHALSSLETEKKVVLMHYSPVTSTIVGEDPEIFPFLGSTRFEEVINRMSASVVFHGHAHHGTHMGKTEKDIPVFNVSLPVLQKEKKEFFVYEV